MHNIFIKGLSDWFEYVSNKKTVGLKLLPNLNFLQFLNINGKKAINFPYCTLDNDNFAVALK